MDARSGCFVSVVIAANEAFANLYTVYP